MTERNDYWKIELDQLVMQLIDGQISASQSKRLDEILSSIPEAKIRYTHLIQVVVSLEENPHQFCSKNNKFLDDSLNEVTASHDPIASLHKKTWNWKTYLAGSVVLSAAAISLLLFSHLWSNPQRENDSTNSSIAKQVKHSEEEQDDEGVAVITKMVDPIWGDGSVYSSGDSIAPGKLSLKSGLLQIEFYQGAIVVVQGPAELEFIDSMRLLCHQGKLRARVPEAAQGFTVVSPEIKVVDLGTEFGLNVNQTGSSSVHVFEGEVEVSETLGDPTETKLLKTNDAVVFSGKGKRTRLFADSNEFISPSKLRELSQKAKNSRRETWQNYIRQLETDPRVLAIYPFQSIDPNARVLQGNLHRSADQQVNPGNGAIVGCQWTEGRWPGKRSLEYKKPSDRVKVNIPGEYDSLTFSAWVRVDGLDRILNALFTTNYFGPGGIQWQISRKGQLILAIRHKSKGKKYRGPSVVDLSKLGNWIHLTTVYDSNRQKVFHYANGKQIHQEKFLEPDTRLVVGKSEIGNWGRRLPHGKKKIRNFNGRIGEMILFRTALSSEEVEKLYQAGKP